MVLRPDPKPSIHVSEGIDPAEIQNQPHSEPSADEIETWNKEKDEINKDFEDMEEADERRSDSAFRPFNHDITPLFEFAVDIWVRGD